MGERLRGRTPRCVGKLAVVGAVGAAMALAGGCGSNGDDGSPQAAARSTAHTTTVVKYREERALFQGHCSACHTLADAGARGTRAGSEANFDAIRPNISSVENYLSHRIGKMPDFHKRLSLRERKAIAVYVADVDGCGISSPTGCDR